MQNKPHTQRTSWWKGKQIFKSLSQFHGNSAALAEEQWHQLAGCLPPFRAAWVNGRGRDHPACIANCLAALYTLPGLQHSPPKACSTGGTVGQSQHWHIPSVPKTTTMKLVVTRADRFSTKQAQQWGNVCRQKSTFLWPVSHQMTWLESHIFTLRWV